MDELLIKELDPNTTLNESLKISYIRNLNYIMIIAPLLYLIMISIFTEFQLQLFVQILFAIAINILSILALNSNRIDLAGYITSYGLFLEITVLYLEFASLFSPINIVFGLAIMVVLTIQDQKNSILIIILAVLVQIGLYLKYIGLWIAPVSDKIEHNAESILFVNIFSLILIGLLMLYKNSSNKKLISTLEETIDAKQSMAKDLISERERTKQAEKMQAIGRLAGAVSHDFNNMLTVIFGYGEFVLQNINNPELIKEGVKEILNAAEKSREFTNDLLTISKRQKLNRKQFDLNQEIMEMERLLMKLTPGDIDLHFQICKDTLSIFMDPGQFTQLIMNLIVNAIEAIEDEGNIIIVTEKITNKLSKSNKFEEFALLEIKDDGEGIDPSILTKIFEPFFSTKKNSSGLGLSTVYGIINQSDAQMSLESNNQGTSFKILFDLDIEKRDIHAINENYTTNQEEVITKSILIVDDEKSIRRLLSKRFEALGYTVFLGSDGSEALSILNENDKDIDYLITDVIMPKINGSELARIATQKFPQLKIIFISGYPKKDLLELLNYSPDEYFKFIQKPFNFTDLLQIVES